MERNDILKQAALLFLKNGYEQYTTKELAEKIGIGKNTIYKQFGSKSNLIEEVLKMRKEIIYGMAEQMRTLSDNAIDNFFLFRKNINQIVPVVQQRENLYGLRNSYPKLYKKAISDVCEITSVCFEAIYLRGLKEGLFIKLDSQIVGEHYSKLFISYRLNKKYHSKEEIIVKNEQIELIFIRGLLSEKGFNYLQKIGNPYEKY